MEESPSQTESPASKVIAFLSRELQIPPERIAMLSRLRQDLGMNGPDAANIIEAFALSFEVDTQNFRVNDYFSADKKTGSESWIWLFWIFGNGKPLKTLRVKDLILAAEEGRLT